MGRGTSKVGGGSSSGGATSLIDKANAPIDESKVGANYKKLPQAFKTNINNNLQLSQIFIDYMNQKHPAEDEWTVGLKGVRRKQKVITSVQNGKILYTVKEKNKILLKTNDKNKVANKVAEYYNQELKKAGVI